MAKKDIFDRFANADDTSRRRTETAAPGDPPAERVTKTRVSKGVVRRRARPVPTEAAPAAEERPAKTVVRRRGAEAPAETPAPEVAAAAPKPAAPVEPKAAPAAPAPEPAPVEAAPAKAAPVEAPAPAVVEPAKEAEPAAAEPVVAKAEEPKAAPVEAPAKAAAEPEAAKPEVAEKPAEVAPVAPVKKVRAPRGLGSAVISAPPGYDPANPEAFHARQRAEQAAAPAEDRTRGRGRRRVAGDVASPASPSNSGAGAPTGADRNRRRRGQLATDGMGLPMRARRRKKRSSGPKAASPQPKAQKRKVRVNGAISVANLAHELSIKAPIIIKKLMEFGDMHTVNDMLDLDTATLVANEFDYEVENVAFDESEFLDTVDENAIADEDLEERPAVVTIMGHVDHGKTTLLDTIRKARVAAGEAGGITQHIGAYQVEVNGKKVTFLDTPGHAAFSAMRARGAGVTDLVILVVAADDGVQPQTVEAIAHARAANVPIVVAVNKCDKPGVNPDNIRSRLGEHNLIPEAWGGDTQFINVSALKATGIDELLEAVLLQAEVLELRAAPKRAAEGTVIEAKMERGRGPVATVLVEQGTLKQGDHVVLGVTFGKVRAMMDHRGKKLKAAGPSTPVEIFGLGDLPRVGDKLSAVANEKNARTLAEHRAETEKMAELAKSRRRTLDDLRRIASEDERKTLLLVIKADVQGSLEALKAAVLNINVDGCEVRILHDGVGNISESDVNLVAANEGILVGFNVKPDARARRIADEVGVKPEIYTVIYDVLDRVESALKGMKEPVFEEESRGSAEVRVTFSISKVGTIAGCYVLDGTISRSNGARLYRDNKEIWKGAVKTLKRFKDDVRQVSSGYECGIALDGYDDIREGDVIQCFEMVRVEVD